jgi:hypothetical protein
LWHHFVKNNQITKHLLKPVAIQVVCVLKQNDGLIEIYYLKIAKNKIDKTNCCLTVTRAEKTNQKHVSINFHEFLADEVMFLQKHAGFQSLKF